MLSYEMMVSADRIDEDPQAGARLRQASREFDETLQGFSRDLKFLPGWRPEIDGLERDMVRLWEEFQPHLDVLGADNAQTSAAERREAAGFIDRRGPELVATSENLVAALRAQVDRARERFWLFFQSAVLFTLLLVILGYVLIRRQIIAPLQRLEKTVRLLRIGTLSARIESEHGDEIGRVEQAFNEMAAEIEGLVETLEERRNFAESVITHTPAGVLIHRDEEVVFANPRLFAAPGIEEDDESPEILRALFAPGADHKGQRKGLQQLRIDGATGARTLEMISVPIEYQGAQAALTMLRDITEQEQMTARMMQMTARMMQMDRVVAIGTLVAGVGHEINNPLSFVLSNIEFSLRCISTLIAEQENKDREKEALSPQAARTLEMVHEALVESRVGAERIRDIVV